MSNTIGISIIGCGAVGSQVARILLTESADLTARTGIHFELRHVLVRHVGKRRKFQAPAEVLTNDPARIWTDPQTRIVVELAGGVDDARGLVEAALEAGKDVVTANKALLAEKGSELFAAARRAGRCIAFEAAVCGGVPLIESIRRGLIANRIDAVVGILNGTCNYILTRMLDNNASYVHALAEAQSASYAEADPALDVSGTDSAHKLAILASLAMRTACEFGRISVQGIEHIELADLTAGEELGYRCKLLAMARRHDNGLELAVQPMFVAKSHPIAGVAGPYNAVSVYGQPIGHVLFYGRGAGGPATASAVIADIVDVAIGNARKTFEQIAVLPDRTPPAVYRPTGETSCPHYIRLGLRDQAGGIGKITTVLGGHGVSIATIVQHESPETRSAAPVPVLVTTHPAKERDVQEALERIAKLDVVLSRPVCIPVFEEAEAATGRPSIA